MLKNQDIPAVVVGLNLNGLGVVRALGRHGVSVIGIGESATAAEARSRYIRDLWVHPGGDARVADLLLARGGAFPTPPVLFPITDASVRAIAANLPELRRFYRIGMPAPSLVETLLDKRGFGQLATDLGLPAPRTFFVDRADQMADVAGQVPYPCILKPQVKSQPYDDAGGRKAYKLTERHALLETYREFCHAEPRMIVQEWIPGGDEDVYFCLQYYDAQSRPLVSFSGHKIRQWPPHCGGTASCEPVDNPNLESLSTAFFRQIGFQGLCSMEFKRDPRDGTFKMIEPTVCRTDWQSGVADVNGVPIPYVAYCDAVGRPAPVLSRPGRAIKWVDFSADRQSADYYRNQGELSWVRWLDSIRPPVQGACWAWDDPSPWLSLMSSKVRGKVRRLLGRKSAP